MPDYIEFDPESHRTVATQHGLHAAYLRKWGQVPQGWLDDFPNQYGTIAHQVHGALTTYYNNRQANVEQQALNHEGARDILLTAAQAVPNADQDHGQQIAKAGSFGGGAPSGGPTPGMPTAPLSSGPPTSTRSVVQSGPLSPMPSGSDLPDQTGQTPLPSTGPGPQLNGGAPVNGSAPLSGSAFAGNTGAGTAPIGTAPLEGVPVGGVPIGAAPVTLEIGEPGDGRSVAAAITDTFQARVARTMPPPLTTGPFAAAAHATKTGKTKQATPLFVVGHTVDDDFVLAHTLLAAILAATADSAPGLEWAVAVLRTPIGPFVLLTSTEGRGWLPPGLFLPSEVTIPWKWDLLLGAAAREAIAKLEGTDDPARMLAEMVAEFLSSGGAGARITALVSSTTIPDDLIAALDDDVALQDGVSAAESVIDFTSPGDGLVDRLTLGGSPELQRQAATVPDNEIRAACREMAQAADTRVRTAIRAIDREISSCRARRQRILDRLHSGERIEPSRWEPIGPPADVLDTEAVRDVALDRRADEVLMLAAAEPDRQTLRDALYAYGQITEHPLLVSAPEMFTQAATASAAVSSRSLGEVVPVVAELLTGRSMSNHAGEQRRA